MAAATITCRGELARALGDQVANVLDHEAVVIRRVLDAGQLLQDALGFGELQVGVRLDLVQVFGVQRAFGKERVSVGVLFHLLDKDELVVDHVQDHETNDFAQVHSRDHLLESEAEAGELRPTLGKKVGSLLTFVVRC